MSATFFLLDLFLRLTAGMQDVRIAEEYTFACQNIRREFESAQRGNARIQRIESLRSVMREAAADVHQQIARGFEP